MIVTLLVLDWRELETRLPKLNHTCFFFVRRVERLIIRKLTWYSPQYRSIFVGDTVLRVGIDGTVLYQRSLLAFLNFLNYRRKIFPVNLLP